MSQKALKNTNEMCLCPLEWIQYGRRIGKKVYSRGGDSWAVKSPGVGTKKEGECPILRQHCNIFHWHTVE